MCAQVLAIQQQQAVLAAAQQQHSMPLDPAQMHHMHAQQVGMPLRSHQTEYPNVPKKASVSEQATPSTHTAGTPGMMASMLAAGLCA